MVPPQKKLLPKLDQVPEVGGWSSGEKKNLILQIRKPEQGNHYLLKYRNFSLLKHRCPE